MMTIYTKKTLINIVKEPVLRYTLLIALVTPVILCYYSFYFVFPQFGDQLAKYTEDAAVRVGNHLKETISLRNDILDAQTFTPHIKSEIAILMRDLRIEKIKIFSKDGTVIYSSTPEEIGSKNSHDYFFNLIAKGEVYSKVVKKNSRTMEGRVVENEVVESYVPFMAGNLFQGAVEVYYDITKNHAILDGLLNRLRISILSFSATFLIVLFLVLIKASRNRLIREDAEASLQKAHAALEQTVAQRTSDLKKSNQALRQQITARKDTETSLQRSHDTQTILNKLLRESMKEKTDPDDVIDLCLELVLSLPWLSFESMGCIYVADEASDELIMKSQKGFSKQLQESCARVPFGKCLCGRAAASRQIIFANHIDKSHEITLDNMHDHGHYCIPILAKGELLGVMNIYLKTGHIRNELEENFLTAVANTLAFILMQRKGEQQKKQIELRLHQSQKMEAIGTLAGGIAHDFNNILSGIFGYAQLALMNIDHPEKARMNIDQINLGAKRATDLIQQILTFSRQADHQKNPVKPHLIVKEALQFLRSSIPTSIEIKKNIVSRSRVVANPTQIHQIVINLCTNAYHAMQETGGTLTVNLDDIDIRHQNQIPELAIPPGSYIRLEVKDTGHGMSGEIVRKIFEPYFTTKPVSEGTGLGLAVVLGIVQEHDGFIHADSTPGKGSIFTIFLPIFDSTGNAVPDASQKLPIPRGSERILLIDDEQSILASTAELLTDYGYQVVAFREAEAALNEFTTHPGDYDVILTDVTMPYMTGDELAVRCMAVRSDIPVILCTGYSSKISKERARDIGIRKYLQKPIEAYKLLTAVRKVLDEGDANDLKTDTTP
jgi:signal transduction histidine kinase/CheY-like chemotaxis protein